MKSSLSQWFRGLLAAILIVPTFAGSVAVPAVSAATMNTVIKGSSPTLYWYSSNGRRYVFPNAKTYFSWYPQDSLANVQIVSDSDLYSIPLASNVTYRPGAKLIKITTDPKVYAVSRYGALRWVTSEQLATTLYGQNWRMWVEDVPDEFFVNYTRGTDLYSTSDYNVNQEYTSVANPNDNIYTGGSINPNPSSFRADGFYLNANQSTIYTYNVSGNTNDQWLTLTANVVNPNTVAQNVTIRIFQENGTLLNTCTGTSCTYRTTFSTASSGGSSYRYYATATNQDNQALSTAWSPTVVVYDNRPSSNAGTITLSTNRTQIANNDTVTFTTTAYDSSGAYNYWIDLYRTDTNTRLGYCSNRQTCTFSVSMAQNNAQSWVDVYAVLRPGSNGYGTELNTSNYARLYFINATNVATPYITYPSDNQVLTGYPRTVTLRWSGSPERRTNVEVSCPSGCYPVVGGPSSSVVTYTTTNYETSKDITFTGDGTYIIRVSAVNESGIASNPSNPITIQFQTSVGSLNVTANKSSVAFGESVHYTASVQNSSFSTTNMKIRMYEETSSGSQKFLKECTGSSVCSVDSYPVASGSSDTSVRPYAVMSSIDTNRVQIANTYGPTVALQQLLSGTLSVSLNTTTPRAGDGLVMTAQLSTSINASRIRLTIYNENGVAIKTCVRTAFCQTDAVNVGASARSFRWSARAEQIDSTGGVVGNGLSLSQTSDLVTVASTRTAWLTYTNIDPAKDGSRRIHIKTSIDPITGLTPSSQIRALIYDTRWNSQIYTCENAYACEFDFQLGTPGMNEYLYTVFTLDGQTITSPSYKVN